jgi:hypothetical protein
VLGTRPLLEMGLMNDLDLQMQQAEIVELDVMSVPPNGRYVCCGLHSGGALLLKV